MRHRVRELFRPVLASVKLPGRSTPLGPDLEESVPEFTGNVGAPGQGGYTSLPDR